MADRTLQQLLAQLKTQGASLSYTESASLLSKAKLILLQLNALTPSAATPAHLLPLARETYEQGALASIRARDPDAFTRYVQQLQPFYELPADTLAPNVPERNKITGLYLLLLLTQGRYAEFHSELESLASRDAGGDETDRYLGYPIRLERWLMEGSYDRVWKATQSREVPCEEYGVFSEVRTFPLRFLFFFFFLFVLRRLSTVLTCLSLIDPDQPNPRRNRLQQRTRLPQPTAELHKVPPLPRLGGRRHRVCPAPRLGRPRRPHLLPRLG